MVSDSTPARGPSNTRLIAANGIGGTTDIHRVMRTALSRRASGAGRVGGCCAASLLPMLPNAQPRPPSTVSTIGTSAPSPSGLPVARSIPMTAMPSTATTMPTTWSRAMRSRRNSTPSSTVNGADVCSTSDASPVGIPRCIARNRKANWTKPNPVAYSRNHRRRTCGKVTNAMTGTAITAKRSAAQKNGGKWSRLRRIAMKFSPHSATTASPRSRSRLVMTTIVETNSIKDNRIVVH